MKSWLIIGLLLVSSGYAYAAESVCYGVPANGRLKGGVKLPARGRNFQAYSEAGAMLGRTHAHSRVVASIVKAYADLQRSVPGKQYVYGETGLAEGGPFKPHKTHQNGLSVDFMVPVLDARGRSVPLPGGASNRYGYDIEFDKNARYRDLRIDFEAMAEHLYALHRAGQRDDGAKIGRVIFAPEFLPKLFASRRGAYLRQHLEFTRSKVWWRHDEHYHVDFQVRCHRR